MLTGRRSATALIDDARDRGSDVVSAPHRVSDLTASIADFASEAQRATTPVIRKAMTVAAEKARDAQDAATPVLRSAAATAAERLGDAAEHAAEALAETAERLSRPIVEQADELQFTARTRLADAGEDLAIRTRPHRRRRLTAVAVVTGLFAIIAGVLFSPMGARLRRLVGRSPDAGSAATTPDMGIGDGTFAVTTSPDPATVPTAVELDGDGDGEAARRKRAPSRKDERTADRPAGAK
jgi:hypothetical protein